MVQSRRGGEQRSPRRRYSRAPAAMDGGGSRMALLLLLLVHAHAVVYARDAQRRCFCGSGSCAQTTLGTVCGRTEQASFGFGLLPASVEVDAFYGVRYATIPRRFAPAEVANATYPVPYQAIQPAPACVGNSGVDKPHAGPSPKNHSHQGTIYSEDCLFVNIRRPTGVDAGDDLPVMVWIHGGGMMGGSGDMDFSRLAVTQKVILVNVNYRLGPLGEISHGPNAFSSQTSMPHREFLRVIFVLPCSLQCMSMSHRLPGLQGS